MFYREAGQFKSSYQADQAIFPLVQDRWFMALVIAVEITLMTYVILPWITAKLRRWIYPTTITT